MRLYYNFFFNLTITNPLLCLVLGNMKIRLTYWTRILNNAPFNFGKWPFEIIVTFLNNSPFNIRTFSSFLTLLNCSGKQRTASFLQTVWQGTLPFLSFRSHVLYTYSFLPKEVTSVYNHSTKVLYFSSL